MKNAEFNFEISWRDSNKNWWRIEVDTYDFSPATRENHGEGMYEYLPSSCDFEIVSIWDEDNDIEFPLSLYPFLFTDYERAQIEAEVEDAAEQQYVSYWEEQEERRLEGQYNARMECDRERYEE